MRHLLILTLLLIPFTWSHASTADEDFAKAGALFESGKFEEAAKAYESMVKNGFGSPDVLFNLGTARFRAEQRGQAALAWRQALVINPRHIESRQNLGFLGRKTGFIEYQEIGSYFGDFFSANTWYTALTASIWVLVLSIASLIFIRPKGTVFVVPVMLAVLSVCAIGTSAFAIQRAESHIPAENIAVITEEETKAYAEPSTTAASVISLPPGSEIKILLDRESWYYVDIPGELRGWVPSKAAAKLQS